MTTPQPTAYPSTPSLRGVRDKYLDLLLTGGNHPHTTPPASTPSQPQPPLWTPGTHLHQPFPTHHHQPQPPWTSPVTPPPPTENEVRLAELAAGLVAAGDAQQRNSHTIRRLADQLHKSERKIKQLQATDRTHRTHSQHSHSPPQSPPPTSRRHSNRSPRSTKRHIRFTPREAAQHEQREEVLYGRDMGKKVGDSREVGGSIERRLYSELTALKKERAVWKREREKSQTEAAKLASMLMDIRQNTQRLLTEREQHLRLIANLQEEVDGQRRMTGGLFSACTGNSDGGRSPVPLFGERQSSGVEVRFRREGSPNSVRGGEFGGEDECVVTGFPGADGRMDEREREEAREREERESELREELRLVLEENERLAERIPALESECLDLSRKLRHAEHQLEAAGESQRLLDEGQRQQVGTVEEVAQVNCEVRRDADGQCVAQELGKLLEEMDIFEAICLAVNFGVGPLEAEQLQDSISTIQVSCSASENKQEVNVERSISNDEVIRSVVRRLIAVRATLSERYGQWLKCVAGDEDSSSFHMTDQSLHSIDKALDVTMDTEVIDEIIRDTSMVPRH